MMHIYGDGHEAGETDHDHTHADTFTLSQTLNDIYESGFMVVLNEDQEALTLEKCGAQYLKFADDTSVFTPAAGTEAQTAVCMSASSTEVQCMVATYGWSGSEDSTNSMTISGYTLTSVPDTESITSDSLLTQIATLSGSDSPDLFSATLTWTEDTDTGKFTYDGEPTVGGDTYSFDDDVMMRDLSGYVYGMKKTLGPMDSQEALDELEETMTTTMATGLFFATRVIIDGDSEASFKAEIVPMLEEESALTMGVAAAASILALAF